MSHDNTGPVAISDADAAAAIAGNPALAHLDPNAEANAAEAALKAKDADTLPSEDNGEGEGEGTPKVENDPNRPAWLPEKFKTVEEMAEAYKALEQKQSGKTDEQTPNTPNDGSVPPNTETGKQAADIVTKAGLDWSKLNDEWKAGGQLSDASYEAFAKQGVSKELVNSFINGQNAMATANANVIRNTAFEAAGGETQLMAAIEWAKDGWDADAVKAFNTAVEGTNKAAVTMAVQGLIAAHKAAGGTEPVNVNTGERAVGGTYHNVEQMVMDMQDPRYDTDPAFRERVARKVERSNF